MRTMKKEQLLAYYPLSSFADIDLKIKEVGKYWRYIEDIRISYEGGAYRVQMLAREMKKDIID
jgi:hypothetical protein